MTKDGAKNTSKISHNTNGKTIRREFFAVDFEILRIKTLDYARDIHTTKQQFDMFRPSTFKMNRMCETLRLEVDVVSAT